VKYRELKQELQEAKGVASKAVEDVDLALEELGDTAHAFSADKREPSGQLNTIVTDESSDKKMGLLAARYNQIRATQRAWIRTDISDDRSCPADEGSRSAHFGLRSYRGSKVNG
jgi:hypothetical protein